MKRPFTSKVYWGFISIMLFIFAFLSFMYNRTVIEGLTNQDTTDPSANPTTNPIASAIVNSCSCPNYDASLNDMQNQISTLQSQINSAISETQQNIQSASDGIANLSGSAPVSGSTPTPPTS
jgi:predicted PurR-regulated permease PerM